MLELFLWKSPEQANVEKVKEELADVVAYALLLADSYDLNLEQIVLDKITKNEQAEATAEYLAEQQWGNGQDILNDVEKRPWMIKPHKNEYEEGRITTKDVRDFLHKAKDGSLVVSTKAMHMGG